MIKHSQQSVRKLLMTSKNKSHANIWSMMFSIYQTDEEHITPPTTSKTGLYRTHVTPLPCDLGSSILAPVFLEFKLPVRSRNTISLVARINLPVSNWFERINSILSGFFVENIRRKCQFFEMIFQKQTSCLVS